MREEYDEVTEGINDVTVLNKLRGSFKDGKQIPRFRDRVDNKRFKTRGFKYDTVVNGTAIEIKGEL